MANMSDGRRDLSRWIEMTDRRTKTKTWKGPDRRKVDIPGNYAIKRSGRDRRTLNVCVALLGLVVAAIPMLIIGLLIKLTSKGPVIYSQKRVGRDRTLFRIYKFRTMTDTNTNKQEWSGESVSRVTPIGRFLRSTRLDELPQFVNVVFGQMNIVGPRPEQPKIVVNLKNSVDGYMDRHTVLPGITGLAQITQAPDASIEDVQNKLELDKQYIQNESVGQDLSIMVKTPMVMFGKRNG